VEHPYQPKYPRAKLREIVARHLGVLLLAGLKPNCRVTFGEPEPGSPEVHGWLIADPRRRPAEVRYLLLEDGDVWREIEAPQAAGEQEARVWLSGPDDDLVTLLVLARNDAQRGGTGLLVADERVELTPRVVDDRREGRHPYAGPERRRP
jgi:hypothetical protein